MTTNQYEESIEVATSSGTPPPYSTTEPPIINGHDEQMFLQIVWRLGICILCLFLMGYIAKEKSGWSQWAKSNLHRAINASTGQTFGRLIHSPAVQSIVANSRDLLRIERNDAPFFPKFVGRAFHGVLAEAVWPVRGSLVRRFGWDRPLPGQERQFSKGIVLAGMAGEPVVAIGTGRVVQIEPGLSFGWNVAVDHSGGWRSVYHNLGQIGVTINQIVATGEQLGCLKLSSKPDDLQLELELYESGRLIDPLSVIGPG